MVVDGRSRGRTARKEGKPSRETPSMSQVDSAREYAGPYEKKSQLKKTMRVVV